jgi:hypothetical protein
MLRASERFPAPMRNEPRVSAPPSQVIRFRSAAPIRWIRIGTAGQAGMIPSQRYSRDNDEGNAAQDHCNLRRHLGINDASGGGGATRMGCFCADLPALLFYGSIRPPVDLRASVQVDAARAVGAAVPLGTDRQIVICAHRTHRGGICQGRGRQAQVRLESLSRCRPAQ